jgi:hypothetical protein
MDIVSEPERLSIASRIARVRDRMLIEVVTGIPASDKPLFLSLCHGYERRSSEDSFQAFLSSNDVIRLHKEIEDKKSIDRFPCWDNGFSDWDPPQHGQGV